MPDEVRPASAEHQNRAKAISFLTVGIFGFLALVISIGGAVAIIVGLVSPTEFEVFGAHLSTIHVGGALVAVGFITALIAARSAQRLVTELAALQPDVKANRLEK